MGFLDLFRRTAHRKGRCPTDGKRLTTAHHGGQRISRCDACGGTWLPRPILRNVAAEDEVALVTARAQGSPTTFPCPACSGACRASVLDLIPLTTCDACGGAWLDGNGIEKAREDGRGVRVLRATGPDFRGFIAQL